MGKSIQNRVRRLIHIGALAVGISAIIVLIVVVKALCPPTTTQGEKQNQTGFLPFIKETQFDISSFLNARRMLDYQQPSAEIVRKISHIYSASDRDEGIIPQWRGSDLVVVDYLPFYRYWQDQEHRYIFHPMAYGNTLARLAGAPMLEKYLHAAIGVAHSLPNGGLLWYYPDNYQLNRMLGPDLHPSAISQGQILGGILALDQFTEQDLSALAKRAFLGLSFDYYKGGVNLKNSAFLEIPLFRAPPEIILNGWLHALLHLRNYMEHYGDLEAEQLFVSNLRFLAKILPNFHHQETGLSLYSDLSPYRIRIHHQKGKSTRFSSFYKALLPEFEDLAFDLEKIDHETLSQFDNQVIRQSPTFTDVWISVSALYETYIVSKTRPFTVKFETGVYSPKQTTPGAGGDQVELTSCNVGDYHAVCITCSREKLFSGYPTNFIKKGANYYHVYHVVALSSLLSSLNSVSATAQLRETADDLQIWIKQWMGIIEQHQLQNADGLKFYDYDTILEGMVKNKACSAEISWKLLLENAHTGTK